MPPRRPLRVVVTAGPTREPLDDVRYLTNASTGRMGIELAREARRLGARVTLVLGPTTEAPPPGVDVVRVVTCREMLSATRAAARGADVLVFAAAPADWRPAVRAKGKLKKDGSGRPRGLTLVENPDIAATLGRTKGARVHVGFALEVQRPFFFARRKLEKKRFDAIVLNSPLNVGRGGGDVFWIRPGAEPEPLVDRGGAAGSKARVAKAIVARAFALRAGR